ncbi:uncharacterized protein LOC119795229 isoform X1 [Cyprinodon tularosa]|uniref:uncharacterized protein LOC119795229 isoform X1 n=2 Tax=Cyprinodon tularosa TaxID=77115 RepID=UPI0018E223BB|nr:uncharacterized protein LOC119795229 isoform X1 [Cyprinodon tularosa]
MEPTADSLRDFLKDRGVSEEFIQKLENEKIDPSVIPLMSDGDLAEYIPKSGDRIAVVAFCRRSSTTSNSRRDHILTRLRRRLSAPGVKPSKNSTWIGNKNAEKRERRIELGWMDFDSKQQQYKQVKAIKGGGTRHWTIDKNLTVEEVRVMAENIFFPDGASKNKKLSCYHSEIQSSQIEVEISSTIEQLYNLSRVRILRLYLCTKLRDVQIEEDIHPKTPQSSTSVADVAESSFEVRQYLPEPDDDYVVNIEIPTDNNMDDTVVWTGQYTLAGNEASPVTVSLVVDNMTPADSSPLAQPVSDPKPPLSQPLVTGVEPTVAGIGLLHTISSTASESLPCNSVYSSVFDLTTTESPPQDSWMLQPPVADSFPESDSDHVPSVTLIIRRGHCLADLIKAFKDPLVLESEIYIKMRLPNGQLEEGEGIGLLRDCITEFWTEFYGRYTMGRDAKVPFIRHDFQIEEWKAVARVLVLGWKRAGYFPVQLAAPFLEEVLYGSAVSSCKDGFLQYVSDQERQILLRALDDIDSVEMETLLDLLDVPECHQVPNKDNLVPLLSQMGHKSIVQAPMYIIECWRPVVDTLARTLPIDELHKLLEQKTTTSKAVKELLQFPDVMTATQHAVARHLKRYIVEADHQTLQNFLRFCTGSNLVGHSIKVEFTETSDFQRRPQAHTCGCILKLPVGYYNYPDLRNDFNSVLTSSVWVMDIV